MGLFGGKNKKADTETSVSPQPTVDLTGIELQNLLWTAGGGYHFRVHPDHISQSLAIFRKNFKNYRYPEWWEGTGFLVPEAKGKMEIIWVRVNGHNVDKLTKTSVDQLRDIVVGPVPIRCSLTIMGNGSSERPSVNIRALKVPKATPSNLPPPPTQ